MLTIEKGFRLQRMFEKVAEVVKIVDMEVPYLYDDHLGHVTRCPSNLGTALKVIVVIELPSLGQDPNLVAE